MNKAVAVALSAMSLLAGVDVHIGMECPNWDLWIQVETGWTFAVDLVVPDPLTFDSVVSHGAWTNVGGGTVSLLLPGGFVEGEPLVVFDDASEGWEHVIVDAGNGQLASGSRPLAGTDTSTTPRCSIVYVSDGLSVQEFTSFIRSVEIQADG